MKSFSILFVISLTLSLPAAPVEVPPGPAFYPIHRTIKALMTFVPAITLLNCVPYGISWWQLRAVSHDDSYGMIAMAASANAVAFLASIPVLVVFVKKPNAFLEGVWEPEWYAVVGFGTAFVTLWAQSVVLIAAGIEMAQSTVVPAVPRGLWGTEMVFSTLATLAVTAVPMFYRCRSYRPAGS